MLAPYQINALRRAGFYGPDHDWRAADYTTGVIIEPGASPESATGPLRLIATDGNLGAFISLHNEQCYYLGHIKYFTGRPIKTPKSKARPASKPKKKSKRQIIIDLLLS